MSGSLQSRINRVWDSPTNAIVAAVFFWDWLHFINDHPGMTFRGYGTGKTAGGTTPPAAWFDWDPTTTPTPPMSDNSWFVFEAVNADNLLDGGGLNPWQAKIQFTLATGFDDCNVADTDYDIEADTHVCCIRASAAAGWDNVTALDFAPTGGEDSSDNMRMIDENNDGKYFLDIVGDDDTIWWKGSCYIDPVSNADRRVRGGHVGLLTRRSPDVAYPFFLMVSSLIDTSSSGSYYPVFYRDWNGMFARPTQEFGTSDYQPSYSLWKDGTQVKNHRHDSWDPDTTPRVIRDVVTNGIVVLGVLVGQEENGSGRSALIGEYRLFGATGAEFGQNVLVGDSLDWIQVAYNSQVTMGLLMRWPAGVAPIW